MPNEQLLYQALRYADLREVRGPGSDPQILEFIHEVFDPNWTDDSTIAWCSIFMNFVAKYLCLENTLDAKPGLARGWLKVGEAVELDRLIPGDVVVFWRGSPGGWQGHVAIFLRHTPTHLVVYGGNQGNAITISRYARSRFLGGRRLRLLDDITA